VPTTQARPLEGATVNGESDPGYVIHPHVVTTPTGEKYDVEVLAPSPAAEPQAKPRELEREFLIAVQSREVRYDTVCKDYELTDLGNSDRFVRRYGNIIKYCYPLERWFTFDGSRWVEDRSGIIESFAQTAARRIGAEAAIGGDRARDLLSHAKASQGRPRVDAMIAMSRNKVAVLTEHLDAAKYLLNFPNGTLDIDTGNFREHRREDNITKITGTEYDPAASCPLWLEHLRTVFDGDEEFISAFQMMAGYCLLADNPEQIIFVPHGGGQNGKSVTLNTLRSVFGDYSCTLPAESLMAQKYHDPTKGRADLAVLRGARIAIASEGDNGTTLSESLVKLLTGEDELSLRNPYGKYQYSFTPGAKIWLITNHLPRVKGTDLAIWRRIWRIPFTVTIPAEKRDTKMGEKLAREAPGILAWCIEGLKRYQENGCRLIKPDKVSLATDEYRADQDVLGDFLSERCTIEPSAVVYASDLYRTYTEWCTGNDEEAMTKTAFGYLIKERFQKGKDRAGYYYKGLRLADQGSLFPPVQTMKTGSTNQTPIQNVTSYDKSFDFPKKSLIGKFESFDGNPNNLSQPVTFQKEGQNENSKTPVSDTSVSPGDKPLSYAGMSREALTAILIRHGNVPGNIPNREAFEQAWQAAGGNNA